MGTAATLKSGLGALMMGGTMVWDWIIHKVQFDILIQTMYLETGNLQHLELKRFI